MARPRHNGARYRSGRLKRQQRPIGPAIDRGQDALVDKRRRLAGGDGRDPRAGYPLGILALRGLITEAHHYAGLRYAMLSAIVWGGRNAASHLSMLQAASEAHGAAGVTEEWVARKEAELTAVVAELHRLPSLLPFRILENVVVYEHHLRCLDTERRQAPAALRVDQAERAALNLALATLVRIWQIEE